MKGVVFTEFLEMVEARFSAEMVDDLLDGDQLPSGGAYTAVGTYNHAELVQIVVALAERTGQPVAALVQEFGHHLFGRFVVLYPQFFTNVHSAFDFLMFIETHIHAEVRKLYVDAELPRFDCQVLEPDRLEMIYRSSRPFADLAEGLIRGCIDHFGDAMTIVRDTAPGDPGGVRFVLERGATAQCRKQSA